MVSPTLADFSFLDAGDDETHLRRRDALAALGLGVNTPTCSHRCWLPLDMKRILSLGLSVPSTTRTSITTPT